MNCVTKAFLRKLGWYTAGTACVSLLAAVVVLAIIRQFPLLPSRDCIVSYSVDGKAFDDAEVYLALLHAHDDPLYFVRLPNAEHYEWLTFVPARKKIGVPSEPPIFKRTRYVVRIPTGCGTHLARGKNGGDWKVRETPESFVAESAAMSVEMRLRWLTVPRVFGTTVGSLILVFFLCGVVLVCWLGSLRLKNPNDFPETLRRALGIKKEVPPSTSSRKKALVQMAIFFPCMAVLACVAWFWGGSLFVKVLIGILMTANVLFMFCLPALAIIWSRHLLGLRLPSEASPLLTRLKTFLAWSAFGFAAAWTVAIVLMLILTAAITLPEHFF